jgi:methyl-accepting chemotaxis protein
MNSRPKILALILFTGILPLILFTSMAKYGVKKLGIQYEDLLTKSTQNQQKLLFRSMISTARSQNLRELHADNVHVYTSDSSGFNEWLSQIAKNSKVQLPLSPGQIHFANIASESETLTLLNTKDENNMIHWMTLDPATWREESGVILDTMQQRFLFWSLLIIFLILFMAIVGVLNFMKIPTREESSDTIREPLIIKDIKVDRRVQSRDSEEEEPIGDMSETFFFEKPMEATITLLNALEMETVQFRYATVRKGDFKILSSALQSLLIYLKNFAWKTQNGLLSISEHTSTLNHFREQLGASLSQAKDSSDSGAESLQEMNETIEIMATSLEQLSISVNEIAKNAADASHVANEAVSLAGTTNETVTQLGVSSQEIGNIVNMITSIAEKTNLLALNATIEAARAGDAGKGFAVVANEVKELARETAKATKEIKQRIESIQGSTTNAVENIQQINDIIRKISEFQNSIACAVEEQSVTTAEISRNISQVTERGTTMVAGIQEVASQTSQAKESFQSNEQMLATLSESIQTLNDLLESYKKGKGAVSSKEPSKEKESSSDDSGSLLQWSEL